jgi:hypothetical protein
VKGESDEHIQNMRAKHSAEMKRGRREIAGFLRDELSKHREDFAVIRADLARLELDVRTLRGEHFALGAAREVAFRDDRVRRQTVVGESREFVRRIGGEMRAVREISNVCRKAI